MGEIIEFPGKRAGFYAELESELDRALSSYPNESAQQIKSHLIEKTRELEARLPSFTIVLPDGASPEMIQTLREQFKNIQDTAGEFVREILLLELKLLICQATSEG